MTGTPCSCGRETSGAVLCTRCQMTLAMCLVNTSTYHADLENVATKAARYGSGGNIKGSIGKAVPLPVDGRFLDRDGSGTLVAYDTWRSCVKWSRRVMATHPSPIGPACRACIHVTCTHVRRHRWPRGATRSMLAYLDRQFRWIVQQDWAAEMLTDMLENEKRLRRVIDRPADRWYAGKCSATDESDNTCEAELYALADSGTITCPACNTEHDVASRRDFLLEQAKDYHVTATEAAQALIAWTDYDGDEVKLVNRIRMWRDRDKLEVAEVTSLQGRDRHLYRLGDVQELLIRNAQDTQAKRLSKTG